MKKVIRLTETELNEIIKKVLSEQAIVKPEPQSANSKTKSSKK